MSPSSSFWRTERGTRLAVAVLQVLLCALAGYLGLRRLGEGLVTLSYDIPFLVHRAGGAEDLRAVYLDELDGDLIDRRVQAPLLDKLREAGARAVIYDIIFDREWPDKAVDQAFADAIRRFRGVDAKGAPIPGAKGGVVLLACGRNKLENTGFLGEQLVPPTDLLMAAAGDEFGLVALVHDDFVVRELVTGTMDEASIAWKTAAALGIKLDEETRLDPRWINYAGPPPDPRDPNAVPAIASFPSRVVLADANPALFRDKVVIIGGRPGLVSPRLGEDLFSTPFHRLDFRGGLPYMSGVEVQANILANLLQGNWLSRSNPAADLSLILAVALAAGLTFALIRPLFGLLLTIGGVLVLAAAGVGAMHYGGTWFPWCIPAFVQLPVALVGSTAAHFYIEHYLRVKIAEEQRKLREAFGKYLSPKMLERLSAEDFHLKIGGDRVSAAMLFTDIESFTDICQRVRDPQRIVENLNGYFERTTSHIFDHDGVVIKFLGDGIFAAWGVPFADERAPLKAVRAAWNLFQHTKFVIGGDELRTRVGLHFGEVVAGNIGSTRHIDYTLIGDAVNLTSRLEGMNKMFGTSILLSEAVEAQLDGEFCTRRLGKFRVKGRQDVTAVFELLGPASQTEFPGWAATYHAALDAIEAGDLRQARALFEQTDTSRLNGDGASRFFLDYLDRGETPEDGVVDLKEK